MKSETLELQPVPEKQPVAKLEPGQVDINYLFSQAIQKENGVETIERLMAVRRELNAEQAKQAFDSALADFQAECPPIEKTKMGAQDRYKYAPLDQIVAQVKGLLQKHGFSYTMDTDTESKDGWIIARCKVTHCRGHSETSTFKSPIDTRNGLMNAQQQYGGALTFAKRYAFVNAFGIMTADEDRDGATRKPKPPGPSKAAPAQNGSPLEKQTEHDIYRKQLWAILKDHRGAEKDWGVANQFCQKHKITTSAEQLPNISVERLKEVIDKARIAIAEIQ